MEVSKGLVGIYGGALNCGGVAADDRLSCLLAPQQSEAPFTINVSQSEALPPTEIYLIGGNDVENESMLEAETPAHDNLSMKEEATTLKHPRAPKNKRQAAPKKFTFDELTHENSLLVESRDEGILDSEDSDISEDKSENNRDDDAQVNVVEPEPTGIFGSTAGENQPDVQAKSPEEMEHEEGAYWFAECGLPQIDEQNSFPTVPFDEEPEPREMNLFCNRPPPTLTPHAVKGDNIVMIDQIEDIHLKNSKNGKKEGSAPPQLSVSVVESRKVCVPTLSPTTAAVMSMVEISSYQDDLEMAPSDELENRCSLETGTNANTTYDNASNTNDMKVDSGYDPDEDKSSTEVESEKVDNEVPRDTPSDEREGQEELQVNATAKEEEDLSAKIPSVVSYSEDSDELLEAPMMTSAMGDLRHQLDQLRVSEALEAVSQSFKDQHFLGAEFCGQQIMDWFGSVSRKE